MLKSSWQLPLGNWKMTIWTIQPSSNNVKLLWGKRGWKLRRIYRFMVGHLKSNWKLSRANVRFSKLLDRNCVVGSGQSSDHGESCWKHLHGLGFIPFDLLNTSHLLEIEKFHKSIRVYKYDVTQLQLVGKTTVVCTRILITLLHTALYVGYMCCTNFCVCPTPQLFSSFSSLEQK